MAEQVFYEIARWRLDEQLDQIRELNSRLMGAFTGATGALGFCSGRFRIWGR